MGEAFEYAEQVATDDIRLTLEWLVGNGFSIEGESGVGASRSAICRSG